MDKRTELLSEESQAIVRALPFEVLLVRPDAEFTIVEASDQYLETSFTNRETLIGLPIFEVFPDDHENPVAEGVERLRNSFNTVMHTKMAHIMDVVRYDVQAPGNPEFLERYWLATNIPVLDGDGDLSYILHRVFDVTAYVEVGQPSATNVRSKLPPEFRPTIQAIADTQRLIELLQEGEKRRRHAEARAVDAGERLDLAVEAADLGTFYCPLPFRTLYWNATCKRHFFLAEDAEVDFDLFYSRIHPDDQSYVGEALQDAITGRRPYDVEYRVVAPDGRCGWLRAKGHARYALDGTPTRLDGITIDISVQKQAELEARQASRYKDEFLAMLAHELRNPLAPLSAAAELLALPNVSQVNFAQTSGIIGRQVKHMSALLDDLLDVSRVTRGMVTLNNDIWDVSLIASAALEQVKPLVEAKHHHLSVILPAEAALVAGDEKRLLQIVANLLTNATKYTPPEGKIELRVDATVDEVKLQVTDNGIGMEPNLIARAFDLFVQGERTLDRSQGGLGLGLALVASLVELHGGTVEAFSSGVGLGSTFQVRLPRHVESVRLQEPDQDAVQSCRTGGQIRVMVVDDNVDAAHLAGELLGALGYDPFVETDPLRALELSRSVRPDAFLLDIGMPEMNGIELAQRLRAQTETADALLIAISGYAQQEDHNRSKFAGFDYHMAKPFNIENLTALLDSIR